MLPAAARATRPRLRIPVFLRAAVLGSLATLGAAMPAAADAGTAAPATDAVLQQAAPLAALEPGAVLRLADGTALRLAFLRLPDVMTDLPAAGDGAAIEVAAWRERSEAALRDMLGGAPVRFRALAAAPDRYGALPALVTAADGSPLQEGLLSRGLARLDLAGLGAPEAEALRAAEAQARMRHLGLWNATPYRVRALAELWDWVGTYQVAVGRVHSAARVGDKFFVNFGPEYDSDVTVLFKGPVARRFRDEVAAGRRLEGCPVLVRGWIEFWNGPLVAASTPAQVEPLESCEGEAER